MSNAWLWQISHPDLESVSFVFGTMHVRDHRAFRYEQTVMKAIASCDAFATEFNLEELNAEIHSHIMDLPEGISLKQLLSDQTYRKTDELLKKNVGVGIAAFENNKPILITNLLTESVLSTDAPLSLDETLWQFAKKNGKIMKGLESYEEQIRILEQIPLSYQVKTLKDFTRHFGKFRKELIKMADLYADAAFNRLYKATRKSAKGMRKLMLWKRNKHMARQITAFTKESSICVAVGAGHLGGKKGILRLLKKKGFVLEPIPAS